MQWWIFALQESRDKQFLVKQIEQFTLKLQIPNQHAEAQDGT